MFNKLNNPKRNVMLLVLSIISFLIVLQSFYYNGISGPFSFPLFMLFLSYLIAYFFRINIILIIPYIIYGFLMYVSIGILFIPCAIGILLTSFGFNSKKNNINEMTPMKGIFLKIILPILITIFVFICIFVYLFVFQFRTTGSESKIKNDVISTVENYMKEKYNITTGTISNFEVDICDSNPFSGGSYCYPSYVIYNYNNREIYVLLNIDNDSNYIPTNIYDNYQSKEINDVYSNLIQSYFNEFTANTSIKINEYYSSLVDDTSLNSFFGVDAVFKNNIDTFRNKINSLDITVYMNTKDFEFAKNKIVNIVRRLNNDFKTDNLKIELNFGDVIQVNGNYYGRFITIKNSTICYHDHAEPVCSSINYE